MTPTPQQPEPSAPSPEELAALGEIHHYLSPVVYDQRKALIVLRAHVRGALTAAETELRATRAELASERAAGADWKNIATQAADKLHAMVLERDRLNAALQDIERNCSLNGFPEDAPEQVAFIAGLVKEALAAPTQAHATVAVMAEADKLEELIRLKLENPGMTREAALEWALEMFRRYSPNAPTQAGKVGP